MPTIDVAQLKDGLSAVSKRLQAQRTNPASYFRSAEEVFRKSVETRRSAFDPLGSPTQPYDPTYKFLDKAYLIWGLRNGNQANVLVDSHIEKLNNWAKSFSSASGGPVHSNDEINFYFVWQNPNNNPVLVNVSSQLMLNGVVEVHAASSWLWAPFWGALGGESYLTVSAELTVWEWWNQPPTQPSQQASQKRDVENLTAHGGWRPTSWSGDTHREPISDSFHVNYDGFLVQGNGTAVFEVSMKSNGQCAGGSFSVDFSNDSALILCPQIQLEFPPPLLGGLTVNRTPAEIWPSGD